MASDQDRPASSQAKDVSELPDAPSNMAGESTSTSGRSSINVSNAHGYLCHITSVGEYDCSPALIFALFTNPDNTGVFRDIKKVTSRTIVRERPNGLKVVDVEQLGEVRILFKTVQFRTLLRVTEDCRDPDNLSTHFELIRSDVLGKFNGAWHLQPIRKEGSETVVGTRLRLEQDVTPRGVPEFLKHMPVLGGVLRGICVRAVTRMLEDIASAISKVDGGERWEDIIRPAPVPVHSHMVADLHISDSDDEATPTSRQGSPERRHRAQAHEHDAQSHVYRRPEQASDQPGRRARTSRSTKSEAPPGQQDGGFWDANSWLQH